MKSSEPPRLPTWLLERLAPRHNRESLVDDLREQFHEGRSAWWYWSQAFTTIVAGVTADIKGHKLLAIRAFVIACAAFFLLAVLCGASRQAVVIDWQLAPRKPEFLRQAVTYYGVPFEIIMCLGLMMTGWIIARWHRNYRAAMVILAAASPWLWAVPWAWETGRLLHAGLWPFWDYRLALLFRAALMFVGYPLCIVLGGLRNAGSDAETA